jgi:hypothetical protein
MSTDFSSYSVLRQASALMLAGSLLQDEVPCYSLNNQIALIQRILSIVPEDNSAYYGLICIEERLLERKRVHEEHINDIMAYAMSIPEEGLVDIDATMKTKEEKEADEAKRRTLNETIEEILSVLYDDDDENVCDDEDL